ncbi:MAG: metallophosphoesterase [Chloroflexota bacterium]
MSDTKINRRTFLKIAGGLAVGGGLAASGSYYYASRIEPEKIVIEPVTIPLKNLRPALEGLKIVQLSDIHLHPYTQIELVERAVAMANTLKPDLAVITGDHVLQEPESVFELAPALAALETRYGVFVSFGNHDLHLPRNLEIMKTGFEESGIIVLQNNNVIFDVGKAQLQLAGLDDAIKGQPHLQAALEGWREETTTLLLAHEPDLADDIAKDGRVALQLSGHSHGGQIRLPGRGALALPPLGRKYDQGLYQVDDMWLYTNRGLGVLGLPIRFNCPPEVTAITLARA